MTERLPWEDIATPKVDYNVRLVRNCGSIRAYWGKDAEGHLLLLFELEGDHRELFSREKVDVRGLRTELRPNIRQRGGQYLELALERKSDRDLFHALCKSLLAKIRPLLRPEAAIEVIFQHLKRWRLFLMGRNPRLLSPQEYRGLFAELLFLQRLLDTFPTQADAVDAWTGPDRARQDFVFSGRAVEVKALSGREADQVTISSENQLESPERRLYLVCCLLDESRTAEAAQSLNALVDAVSKRIVDGAALMTLENKLANYGYVNLPEYDTPELYAADSRAYLVDADFPRIVRSALPAGICRVRYQIDLNAIQAFFCPLAILVEDI